MKTFITADDYNASGYEKETNTVLLEKLIMIASQKINIVAEEGLNDLSTLSQEKIDALKEATMIVVDHWISGGWDWKKTATSASLGSINTSISRMQSNDIVPEVALNVLQNADLYFPLDIKQEEEKLKNNSLPFTAEQVTYLIANFLSTNFANLAQQKLPLQPDGTSSDPMARFIYMLQNGVINVVSAADIIKPEETIYGKEADLLPYDDIALKSAVDAVVKALQGADKSIEAELATLRTEVLAKIKKAQDEVTSLSGRTSGGFNGNISITDAAKLSTKPKSADDYYYYHITTDPETILGTPIAARVGKWVKIGAKADLSGWEMGTTFLDNSPFGIDVAGINALIADAEARVATLIDTKIKPVADWFEAEGQTMATGLEELAREAKALEAADDDIRNDIRAAVARVAVNEAFKKLFDDMTDGGVVFKTNDNSYKTMTAEQIMALLSDPSKYSDATLVPVSTKTLTDELAKKVNITDFDAEKAKIVTLEGKMTTVEGKVTTAEGKITTVETQQAVHATSIADHGAKITANKTLIDALNGQTHVFHFGTVLDANAAITTNPTKYPEGQTLIWIGTTGAWTGYHVESGAVVANGASSTHGTTTQKLYNYIFEFFDGESKTWKEYDQIKVLWDNPSGDWEKGEEYYLKGVRVGLIKYGAGGRRGASNVPYGTYTDWRRIRKVEITL